MENKGSNYTKIKVETRYTDVSQMFITIENKAKGVYIEMKAWYYETRNSWGHKGYIWGHVGDNYCNTNDFKIRYYNRTWECYRFQSLLSKMFYGCGIKADKKFMDKLWKKIDAKARYA